MSGGMKIEDLPVVVEMAEGYGLSGKALVHTVTKNAIDGKFDPAELLSCLMVAKEHGLNPLTREIYFMRGKGKKDKYTGEFIPGQIQPIVSVDGWIKKCNQHHQFDGLEFQDNLNDKGKLVSITCQIYRKDRGRPTTVTEYMDECRPEDVKFGPWKTHPSRMLRHRALIQCARVAFGFAGVMDPDEYSVWQQTVDVTPEPEVEFVDIEEQIATAQEEIEDAEVEAEQVDLVDYLAENGGVIQVGDRLITPDAVLAEIEQEMAVCQDMESLDEVLEQWDLAIQNLPRKHAGGVESLHDAARQRIEQAAEEAA